MHAEHKASVPRRGFPRALILFAVILFLDFAAISAIAGIYGPYARRTLDVSLFQTAVILLPAGAAGAVSLALVSRFSRPGRRFLEMASLYTMAMIGALGLSLNTEPAGAATIAVLLGLGAGGIAPLVAAMMLDAGSGKGGGVVIGTLMSMEGLGSVAGPATVAFVTDFQGPRAGFVVIATIFGTLAPLCLYAGRRSLGVGSGEVSEAASRG